MVHQAQRRLEESEPQQSSATARPRLLYESCPLCQSRDMRKLRTGDCSNHPLYQPIVPKVMNWMECSDCGHAFTDGYLSPEVMAVVFSRTHENQRPGFQFEAQRMVSSKMVERVARFAENGRWLDVGFGNGSLLFTAQEWGFDPVGLDLRRESVEAMEKLGIEAHCIDIFDLKEGQYSVISMADVLEHLPFPKKGLEAAHRVLAPEGILFLSMPNYKCLAWQLLDLENDNPYWGELEHFHNFSRARLYSLLEEHGFAPLLYNVSQRYRVCMEVIARRIS